MSFEYISVAEARQASGLRMVVVGNIPSPWGEAAKGILHAKGINWQAVRLVYDDSELAEWAGGRSGPVAFFNDDRPRSGWHEILLLAERIAPTPSLVPIDADERALMLGLAHEIMSEEGLCWSRRLQLIHGGLNGEGGFSKPAAEYLAKKYGYRSDTHAVAGQRVVSLLGALASRLARQRAAGSSYLFGDTLTALDIYSAAAMALFSPLPPEQCDMRPETRAIFDLKDAETVAALDGVLLEHRDWIYENHLELPLSL